MESQPANFDRRSDNGEPSGVAASFRSAWLGDSDASTASMELFPVRLAKACGSVLPVDGAGMSLHLADFRVPIGASDEMATLAERLQFTQGDGPCMDSARTRRTVTVDAAEMQRRWPSFADELVRQTPYRGILSLPVAILPQTFAALDLYFVDPGGVTQLTVADVTDVTAQVAEALAAVVGTASAATDVTYEEQGDVAMPIWLHVTPARDRTYVWVAMGMLMSQFWLSATDAVAVLRSFAYGHDRLLDDVALELVNGTLLLDQLQP